MKHLYTLLFYLIPGFYFCSLTLYIPGIEPFSVKEKSLDLTGLSPGTEITDVSACAKLDELVYIKLFWVSHNLKDCRFRFKMADDQSPDSFHIEVIEPKAAIAREIEEFKLRHSQHASKLLGESKLIEEDDSKSGIIKFYRAQKTQSDIEKAGNQDDEQMPLNRTRSVYKMSQSTQPFYLYMVTYSKELKRFNPKAEVLEAWIHGPQSDAKEVRDILVNSPIIQIMFFLSNIEYGFIFFSCANNPPPRHLLGIGERDYLAITERMNYIYGKTE